jgi:C4-dicarboxylate-binding protein DctP
MPKGAAVAKGFDWFGAEFEKATNGRYKVEIYPGSTLHQSTAALDVTKSGAAEMVYTSAGTFPKQFPLTMVTNLPSLGFPQDTVKMYISGNNAFWEFYKTSPEIQNEFKDTILVQPYILAPYQLVAKKAQIKSATDFKGLKVGGTGAKMELVTANGGAKVQEIPPDAYLDMDKGVTDATFITFSQVHDYKIPEIAIYFLSYGFGNGGGIILMNPAFYNAMGAADQKILADTWIKAQEISAQGSIGDGELGLKDIAAAGKKVYVPTDAEVAKWDSQATPSIDSWRKDAKLMGANDATLDMVLEKWKAIRTKYLALGAK